MKFILYTALLLATTVASAQTTRVVQNLRLWPEVQGEVALKNGDYLLLTLRGERTQADASSYQPPRHLGFDAGQVRVGYEHFWNANWSWGATARFNGGSGQLQTGSIAGETFTPELLLRHRAPIFGGITFGQRLGVERIFPTTSYVGGSGPGSQTWTRLRVDLEKIVSFSGEAAGLALRPRLSYEAGTHLRFQKDANDQDERTIQYTSLRAEVGVRLSPAIDLTPWFAYQTGYLETLPQYDRNGVQTSGGKLNIVYPTLGLEARFTILPTGGKADRQQLPTQH
ncbi:hypothetical protein QMK33_06305 [Hymenobacter sp. H14-R3]|uniref:hypothetical protein n=1 Tax=Hymenobacter sp. H14-R3 TaxID=3046308 RepID=UPI0024BAA2B1|nr:hypothetical protein [Hymenobacter sp. H14-R3]MDJ0364757.1 hypothetical protein [Hymenobacter sp. H14-R3]